MPHNHDNDSIVGKFVYLKETVIKFKCQRCNTKCFSLHECNVDGKIQSICDDCCVKLLRTHKRCSCCFRNYFKKNKGVRSESREVCLDCGEKYYFYCDGCGVHHHKQDDAYRLRFEKNIKRIKVQAKDVDLLINQELAEIICAPRPSKITENFALQEQKIAKSATRIRKSLSKQIGHV